MITATKAYQSIRTSVGRKSEDQIIREKKPDILILYLLIC
jgi:hypothetical protein